MTTEPAGTAQTANPSKGPKHAFYHQLALALNEGGFDRHMGALCKPFIGNAQGPDWWTAQPSSYFRILFVGFLEGIESEQDLCWLLEDSRVFRTFVGFGEQEQTPDPVVLGRIRQPLLPLIHSEAFDTLLRIIEKFSLLDARLAGPGTLVLASDPSVSPIIQRIRSKDHHNYWKRLTKMAGTGWSTRPSTPPAPRPTSLRPAAPASPSGSATEPFALWVEDLSLAQAEFAELRQAGVTDFKAHFDQQSGHSIDHVIRACIYGRGPNSVRAFLATHPTDPGRELPQQLGPSSLDACRAIAVALAEGKRQFAVEIPLLDAAGQPATAFVQLAVQPGSEDSLSNVIVSFTDITARKRQSAPAPSHDLHIERTLCLNQIGVWEWDIVAETTEWSDAMLRIYGITREEFTGRHADYQDFTYPDDREIQHDSVRQSFADFANQAQSLPKPADSSTSFKDYRIRRKDGQIRWVRGGAVETVDDQGRPLRVQGVLWDITESKQAELELEENEERFRRMVEGARLPLTITAFDGEVIYFNESALSFFGTTREQLPKLREQDYWEDPAQRDSAATMLAENGELRGFEARYRIGADREPRTALMTASVIDWGGRNMILGIHQDITGLRCVEEQLIASQQQAEELLRTTQQQLVDQVLAAQLQAEERLRTAQQLADDQVRAAQLQAVEAIASCKREVVLLKRMMLDVDREPTTVLESGCHEIAEAFELPLVAAALLLDSRNELSVVAEEGGPNQRSHLGVNLPLSEAMLLGLFSEDPHPVWIEDAAGDPLATGFRSLLLSDPSTPLLLLPLVLNKRLMGVLLLGTGSGRQLSADARQLVWIIAGQIARALGARHLHDAYQQTLQTLSRIRDLVGTGK